MIDLVTFKQNIENNTFVSTDNLFIFIGNHVSSKFIFNQYLHTYTANNMLEIITVEELRSSNNFFDAGVTSSVEVFRTDKLDYIPKNFKGWIFCTDISQKIKTEYDAFIIELPKLEKWQVIDYIMTKCKISLEQAEQLVKEYDEISKLDIEASKLTLFDTNYFDIIKDQLFYKDEYELFDLTNAILKRDINALKVIYASGLKVDVFAFIGLLIKNFKLVIDIQLSKNASAQSLGISDKQFWAVSKYNCYKYTRQELIQIYLLLTSLDLKIKTGQISTTIVQDYVIFKIISL